MRCRFDGLIGGSLPETKNVFIFLIISSAHILRHWCSGNINPFQGLALDSISRWRTSLLHV